MPSRLTLFLKARNRERFAQIYMCDALWVISGALGNELPRYADVVRKKKQKADTRTTEQVVDGIIEALEKDRERRLKNGNSGI